MSQYWLVGKSGNYEYDVLLGWDEPMRWFFMVIEPNFDEPVYCNLHEPNPRVLTLEYFQSVLEKFGIENIVLKPNHDSGLYESLLADKLAGK